MKFISEADENDERQKPGVPKVVFLSFQLEIELVYRIRSEGNRE